MARKFVIRPGDTVSVDGYTYTVVQVINGIVHGSAIRSGETDWRRRAEWELTGDAWCGMVATYNRQQRKRKDFDLGGEGG